MKSKPYPVSGGVYLVVDPSALNGSAFEKISQALQSGLAAIQLWNNWKSIENKTALVQQIIQLADPFKVPVLINGNSWLLKETEADGIHLDEPSGNLDSIRNSVNRPLIIGITCGNSLNNVQYAVEQNLDYISFCSVFPSGSANSCEWVQPATIAAARAITNMPIFAAGGITTSNLSQLLHTGLDGIAVINSIMKAEDPAAVTSSFKQILKQQKAN